MSSSILPVEIGIERGAGFVHQQDFGFDGECARDAQALLLAAGKARPRFLVQIVFDFFPQRRACSDCLHGVVEMLPVAKAVELEARGDVVVDRHGGKRIRLLKDHADAAAQLRGGGSVVGVEVAELYLALDPRLGIVSCMRFRQRMKVDFPQPEGPISAVA